jgi:hypothetical protein
VLSKENGGQGSARNLGLTAARGEWVTFPDPDDAIASDYLERVSTAIDQWPDVAMVAANLVIWNDSTGERVNSHPLRARFSRDRLVRLNSSARYFFGSAPAAFLRRSGIEQLKLTFDERIQPNFEDGHFCARYLLNTDEPTIAFLSSAEYFYRKRSDGSSTLNTKRTKPGHYLDAPRYGYLAILQEAKQSFGFVPEWLQHAIIYELSWYFTEDEQISGSPSAATGDVAKQFVALLRQIASHLDPDVVMGFNARSIKRQIREIIAFSLRGVPYATPYVEAWTPAQRLESTRLVYRFTGAEPRPTIHLDGFERAPAASKVQAIQYFGHDLLFSRIMWLTGLGELRLRLDGRPVPTIPPPITTTSMEIRDSSERASETKTVPHLSWLNSALSPLSTTWRSRGKIAFSLLDDAALSATPAQRFHNAWVLMDRATDANDNAEHLFRHLRDNRPDVNAWFVLAKHSRDWNRLVHEGYGDRLVEFGSGWWKVLMRHCLNLVVSHPNREILRPQSLRKYWDSWTVTFLQHGVMRDDISRWMNTKRFDLFVTSTPAETASVTDDGSPYKFTSFETKMVGLARFDRLSQVEPQYPAELRDLVLVAPTWRELLNKPLAPGATRREIVDDFESSDFARRWSEFFAHPEFLSAVHKLGKRVALLMHPNLQAAVHRMGIPDSVMTLHFEGADVQEYFARAALMVTDYSSMTFNEAFMLRPTVYFQFDRDSYYNGANHARAGYFDHVRDGFGPVALTAQDAHRAVLDLLEEVPKEYVDRMRAAFPYRDGRNCERTVTAIEDLHRPYAERRLPELLPE